MATRAKHYNLTREFILKVFALAERDSDAWERLMNALLQAAHNSGMSLDDVLDQTRAMYANFDRRKKIIEAGRCPDCGKPLDNHIHE